MVLKNAFEDMAVESTQSEIKVTQMEMLNKILIELRILNKNIALMSDTEIDADEVESEES